MKAVREGVIPNQSRASGFPVLVAVAIPVPRGSPVTRGEAQPGARLFWMNSQPSPGNSATSTSLTLKVLSVENGKSPRTSTCTRCQKKCSSWKTVPFFFKHCIIVLTLRVFLLFVWFCPQMHVLGFFVVVVLYPFSSVHVFIAFLGVCSCLKK